ncbi:MAG: hypothetical protein R3328_08595 [Planococcaceae bacterium]|nr:hypothetical protein [Bacillota bacterium]MDX1771571.1 hypothetical protein [Planococcaceae bacterium]
MNILRIGANILIPLLILFLAFATWMGYIAENIKDLYNYKWAAIALLVVGYILQFNKRIFGLILVGLGILIWFLL